MLYFGKPEMCRFNKTPLGVICVVIGTTAKSPLNLTISGSDEQIADAWPVRSIVPFENATTVIKLRAPITVIGDESWQFRQLHTHETSLTHCRSLIF